MLTGSWIWLGVGLGLCLTEALFPTAFVALVMGLSAIAVGAIAWFIDNLLWQVLLWLMLSSVGIILSRRFLHPTGKSKLNLDAQEGQTLTEIAPGEAGRVLYEGNSWRALCEDENLAIAPQEKVYVLRRKGNTLIVLPAKF